MKNIRREPTWEPNKQGMWQGLSFEQYLAAPGFNNHKLGKIDPDRGGCPAKAHQPDKPQTPQMRKGSLAHAAALENVRDWVVSAYDNYRTKEAREWRDIQTLPVLTQAEEREILAVAKGLREHPLAWPLIKGGRREVSMFAKYGDRYLLKCRPDITTPTHFVDMKTCRDASTHSFARDIQKYGYNVQAAIVLKAAAILGLDITSYYLVAVEWGDPPLFNVRKLSGPSLEAGQRKLDELLEMYSKCERTGLWPDYSGTEIGEIEIPHWALLDEMDELLFDGEPI